MKMIASSRLKDAQNRMEASRPFTQATQEIEVPSTAKGKTIVLPVTTDKGLCGGLNSSVIKLTKTYVSERESEGESVSLVPFGDKGNTLLARGYGNKIGWSAGGSGRRAMGFSAASIVADRILQQPFDKLNVVYNQFNSVISFGVATKSIVSFEPIAESAEALTEYEFEDDDRLPHMKDLLEFQLASLVFQAATENFASELGSRMSAMDNASKNAGEMIKSLNTKYNRARQAAITTELTEIISGASAVE